MSTGSTERGDCSRGEREDEAEGEGVTMALPGSAGTLPWLSGCHDFSPGCVPCESGIRSGWVFRD